MNHSYHFKYHNLKFLSLIYQYLNLSFIYILILTMTLLQAGDVPRSLKTRLLYHVRVSRHRAVYHPTIPASSNMKPTWEELPNSGHPRNIRVYSPEICWFPGRMTSLVPFASAGFIASTRRPLATSWRLGGPLGEGPKATTHGFFFDPDDVFFFEILLWCDILLQP